MKYLNELAQVKKKDKLKVVPHKLEFYEKYVNNFSDLKRIFIMTKELKEYIEIMNLENESLKKIKLIKEKF